MASSSTKAYLTLVSLNKSEILKSPELPLDMQFNEGHRTAIVIYLCLLLISASGNIYVVQSILRSRKHKKLGRINLLLFNLTIADLLVTFIMMPLEITWNATVSWHAGDLACRLLSFARVFGLYLSGFVLICICLDRYFAIIKPLAIREAKSRNNKLLRVAWIASVICSLPQSFIFHVQPHPEYEWYKQCITFNTFPTPMYELAYNLFGFCFLYAIPMMTIVYCYCRILCRIFSIPREMRNGIELRRCGGTALVERVKRKTLKMTVMTMMAFFVCWTPYNIISLWYWFDKTSAMELDQRLQKALFAFACTNSCVNPLIYGWYRVNGSQTNSYDSSTTNHPMVTFVSSNLQRRCSEDREQGQRIRIIRNPCSNLDPFVAQRGKRPGYP